MRRINASLLAPLVFIGFAIAAPAQAQSGFALEQVLHYPYPSSLVAAEQADAIAWVINQDGARNIWVARGPDFKPQQVTQYREDDGQELSQLTFSPDGAELVFVRSGDHDGNWPTQGPFEPNPALATEQPAVTIWQVTKSGKPPRLIAKGDNPALSNRGQLAFTRGNQVWSVALKGKLKPEALFPDQAKDSDLRWSPDGKRLAFVSNRGDHSYIGIYSARDRPLQFLAPSTNRDSSPRWSPDGSRLAFVRRPGIGGAPQPLLTQVPQPWSIWVASVADDSTSDTAHRAWQSPDTLAGSFPDVDGGANLRWAAGDRLVFLAYLDDWQHLYSLPAAGGEPLLLTPGDFMVEHVTMSRDRGTLIYSANTGATPGDFDRRHLFVVPIDRAVPVALTSGESIDWAPVSAASDRVAFIAAGVQAPPEVALVNLDGTDLVHLAAAPLPADFPREQFLTPKPVSFQAADGLTVHGQLFDAGGGPSAAPRPALIFVHGGPPRQMLLGWHYMDYYSNAYAVNQYLAAHGFIVLSVNYRLGIGYGRAYHQPDHAGPAGAAEYQDVLAGAHYLAAMPGVDPKRIGIWGGSYGGYLTALALARNSDLFAAGVDWHGVHDWSQLADEFFGKEATRYEQGDREEFIRVAWTSSPDSSVGQWASPVLLVHGDDDRNVPFNQTVDIARRLDALHVPYEELVIPNDIHGFLLHRSYLAADQATVDFFARHLQAAAAPQ